VNITGLRVESVAAPYAIPFAIAGGTTQVMESLLVHLEDDTGVRGIGEVNPMPAYSGIPVEAVRHAIESTLTDALVGAPVAPGVVHSRMDAVCRGPAARLGKAAIDIALHDLLGRRLGVPVSTLLGGAHTDVLSLAWPVGLREVDETVEEAWSRFGEGYRTIKLKVGRDPKRDVAAIRAVRAALPDAVLRVDANGGYDPETGIAVFAAVQDCGLELVEQPIPPGDPASLRRVRRATGIPIIADESFQSVEDVVELARAEACDGVNIKITKPGGLYRARQAASIAEAAGLSVLVGSMPEMEVATAAGLHFAQSLPTCEYATELIGPAMLGDAVVRPGQLRYAAGTLSLPGSEAGLGLSGH
jgi:L-Ala-D/L-Glu epimerase